MQRNKDGYFRKEFVVGKTADGKPKRIKVRAKTKKELELKLNEAKRLHGHGVTLDEWTVNDWGERWLTIYKANASVTQKAHYKVKLENDIYPAVGSMRMRDVRPSHLQEILNTLSGGRIGTVQKVRGALRQLFEDAEIEGIIERSPAARLVLPEMTEAKRRPLTTVERITVYEVAKTHKVGTYILTMLFCGLRRGECIALLVGDIDFERSRIRVNKSLSFLHNVGTEKETKSKAGMREVPIPKLLLPFLLSQCADKSKDDVLFPIEDGSRATKQACTWWWRSFKRQCHIMAGAEMYRNKIKIDTSPFSDEVSPHYLRHTYATDLYAAGVDDKAQKSFLGHSSSDVTDIYRKMNEAAFTRAIALIDSYNAGLCFCVPPLKRTTESFRYCIACKELH